MYLLDTLPGALEYYIDFSGVKIVVLNNGAPSKNVTNMNDSSVWNATSMCANGTCLDYKDAPALPKVLTIVVPVIFAFIIVSGIFGNVLVVVVVVCNQQMRSTTNILITNLAMADLLFLFFCAPFTASKYAFSHWAFGDVWCRIFQYLVYVSASASIHTLVLLSVDRFLAVVHPVSSIPIRTRRNAFLVIGSMWTVVLISFTPLLAAHGVVLHPSAQENYSVCAFLVAKGYNYAAFYLSFFLSSYILPLVTIFVLYMLMMKRILYGVTSGGQCGIRSKKRVTRLIIVVIVIFAVCWSPVQVIFLLRSFHKFEITTSKLIVRSVAEILAYFNSCVNPILYAFLSENFRKAFRKLLSRGLLRACRPCGETKRVTVDETTSNIPESSKDSNDIL